MAPYVFETNLTLGNEAETVPAIVDPLRDALSALTLDDPSVGSPIDLNALSFNGGSSGALVDSLCNGVTKFAYGSANRITGEGDELIFAHLFGMEVQEFCSWWYSGTPGAGLAVGYDGADSGEQIVAAQVAAQAGIYSNMVVFPINVSCGESGGWYKEAVTLKKMVDGKWSDGTDIKIRLADEAKVAHAKAFPLVATPAPVLSGSWLQDAFNDVFNCGEYNSPLGDSSLANGMFPNYPSGGGGIVDAGVKHYYIGSWQTPFRGRVLMVNKTFFEGLSPAQRAMIRAACYQCHMQNLSYQLQGQDAIMKKFQEFGATIHEQLPRDYLLSLRQATDEIYDEWAVTKGGVGGNEYGAMRDHQRLHIKANQVRWRSGNLDRRFRFQSRLDYEADLQTNG